MATVTVAASDAKKPGAADYRCSGSSDQTTINAAIAALPASGGRVVLSEGTFYVTGRINLYSNMLLQGQGAGATTIKLPDGHGAQVAGMIRGDGYAAARSNITIQDLTVDANDLALNTYGIYMNNVDHARIINTEVKNTAGGSDYGLLADGGCTGLTVVGCYFHDCGNNVIEIKQSPGACFVGNQFTNGKCEFYTTGSPQNSISMFGNWFSNCSVTTTPDSSTIESFVFADNIWECSGAGQTQIIWFRACDSVIMSGNIIDASGSTLVTNPIIQVDDTTSNFRIINNTIKTGYKSDISRGYGAIRANGVDGVVSGNAISAPYDYNFGIKVSDADAARVTISDNTITGTAATANSIAISIEDGDYITVRNNTCKDCGKGYYVAEDADNTLLEGGRFISCSTDVDNNDTSSTELHLA